MKNTKPFVSDPMMPGVDGFAFAKPSCSRNENIPILFMTAEPAALEPGTENGTSAGCSGDDPTNAEIKGHPAAIHSELHPIC